MCRWLLCSIVATLMFVAISATPASAQCRVFNRRSLSVRVGNDVVINANRRNVVLNAAGAVVDAVIPLRLRTANVIVQRNVLPIQSVVQPIVVQPQVQPIVVQPQVQYGGGVQPIVVQPQAINSAHPNNSSQSATAPVQVAPVQAGANGGCVAFFLR